MSVDMTKWCEIAKANMGKRPAGEGRLGGKICIVTGAAQGFGKGIAEELYKEGATIVIADMNEPLAKQVAEEMGERAVAIAVNVSDEEILAAQRLLGRTCGVFGEPAGVTGAAALKKACEEGLIPHDATVVSVVTGNGLKDVANAIKSAGEPLHIEPDLDLMVKSFAQRGVIVE